MSNTIETNKYFFHTPMNEVAYNIHPTLHRFVPTSFSFVKTKRGVRAILKSKENIIAHTYL